MPQSLNNLGYCARANEKIKNNKIEDVRPGPLGTLEFNSIILFLVSAIKGWRQPLIHMKTKHQKNYDHGLLFFFRSLLDKIETYFTCQSQNKITRTT